MNRTNRPTLLQLRQRVFKHSTGSRPEIGNVLARRIGRPSAVYGTWVAVRVGLTANQVTAMAVLANLLGAVGIGWGSQWGFSLGVLGLIAGYWLDHVDGQLARWRDRTTISGVYFDYMLHHLTNLSVGFAMGFGLTARTGGVAWTIAGFAIAAGWTMLSLHNDCRYKAIFQRLKATDRGYRVDSRTRPQPAAPPSWPLRWPGIVTWPMAKLCEFHVVLVVLTVIVITTWGSPLAWLLAWQGATFVMAMVAPALAMGRIARSISRGEADAEFHSWFRVE